MFPSTLTPTPPVALGNYPHCRQMSRCSLWKVSMLHVAWFALITNMHAVANPTRKKAATTPLHVAGLHPSRRLHWLVTIHVKPASAT